MSRDEMEAQTEFYAPIIEFYERFAPFPFKGYGAVDSARVCSGGWGARSVLIYDLESWRSAFRGRPRAISQLVGSMINNPYLTSFWNKLRSLFGGCTTEGVPIGNVKERSTAFIRDRRSKISPVPRPPACAAA